MAKEKTNTGEPKTTKSLLLTKGQVMVFTAFSLQKAELQKEFQNILEAEQEQINLLVKAQGLQGGEYRIIQEGDEVWLHEVLPQYD